jgi:hypothetical protein
MDGSSSGDPVDALWVELCTRCDLARAAATLAWGNYVETHRLSLTSVPWVGPSLTDALLQWRSARAQQLAAEQALMAHIQDAKPPFDVTCSGGDAPGLGASATTGGP